MVLVDKEGTIAIAVNLQAMGMILAADRSFGLASIIAATVLLFPFHLLCLRGLLFHLLECIDRAVHPDTIHLDMEVNTAFMDHPSFVVAAIEYPYIQIMLQIMYSRRAFIMECSSLFSFCFFSCSISSFDYHRSTLSGRGPKTSELSNFLIAA